jgi:hypothetical protein
MFMQNRNYVAKTCNKKKVKIKEGAPHLCLRHRKLQKKATPITITARKEIINKILTFQPIRESHRITANSIKDGKPF